VGEAYLRKLDWSRTAPASLPEGAIHLWRLPLGLPLPLADLLDERERARFGRLQDPGARRFRGNGRALLRLLLGHYLARSPASLELVTEAGGKPRLAGGELRFNLSHSEDLALVAISRSFEVGVDLERVRPVQRPERIAARMFDADARRALEQCPEEERLHRFFEQWTRLEARQKCSGAGLFGGREWDAPAGTLSFEPEPGCKAALAWRHLWEPGREPELRFFQFAPRAGKIATFPANGTPSWS